MIGSAWLIEAFTKDITNDLIFLNIARKSKRGRMKVKQHLSQIVRTYSHLKELSEDFDYRFQIVLFNGRRSI